MMLLLSHTLTRLIILLLGAIMVCISSALAEPVRVQIGDQYGQGWIFGAETSALGFSCWVVTARHVVDDDSRALDDASLILLRSNSTQVETYELQFPPAPSSDKGDALDLAFSPIKTDQMRGADCTGRLHANSGYLDLILARQRHFDARFVSETTTRYSVFENENMSNIRGLMKLRLMPSDSKATVSQGDSGTALTYASESGLSEPVAMVLKVDPTNNYSIALRFDRIATAFQETATEFDRSYRKERAETEGIPYSISKISALTLLGNSPSSSLQKANSCWKAVPSGGHKYVSLELMLDDKNDQVGSIEFVASELCDQSYQKVIVHTQRKEGSRWKQAGTCRIQSVDRYSCSLNVVNKFHKIRLTAGQAGEFQLDQVILR